MITIVCESCSHALRVGGELSQLDTLVGKQSEYWPDNYTCYNCGEKASGFLTPEISTLALQSLAITDVTVEEAFAALNGLGIPDERTCCEEVVLPYFNELGIKVKGRKVRAQLRYIVDELTFPDGTRMQLGSCAQGAVIYRIIKKHSYVASVDKGGASANGK